MGMPKHQDRRKADVRVTGAEKLQENPQRVEWGSWRDTLQYLYSYVVMLLENFLWKCSIGYTLYPRISLLEPTLEMSWLGKTAKSIFIFLFFFFFFSFRLLLRWSMGNITWQSQSHKGVTEVTECHVTHSHKSQSQHVTKKSADRHEDCGRQDA